MKIIMLGAPGAGKGTQAQLISEKYNLPQISTGDLLRKAVADGTELGKIAQEYMNAGKLGPDDLIVKLIKERIEKDDCKGGYILDGFPRTLNQASEYEKIEKVETVISIDVDEGVLLERLTGRRTCGNKECNAVYHVTGNPPKQEGVCDKCGTALFQRDDDTAETVKSRLATYHDQTAPLIGYYKDQGTLKTVVSRIGIEDTFRQITEALQ